MPLDFELDEEPILSRSALDRAADLRHSPEDLDAGWANALVLRVDPRGRFMTDREGVAGAGTETAPDGLRVLLEPAFDIAEAPPRQSVFLGRSVDGRHVWALAVDSLPESADRQDLRSCGAELLDGDAAMAAEAVALINWHRDAIRDRGPEHHPRVALAGWAGEDPFHGNLEFPRTDPAVICLVHDARRQVLLARSPGWPEGRFSVLAGFVEAGESLENCVRREVEEEVGLRVKRVRYLGSQPWPFPRSLMVAFHATADPDAPLQLEPSEITEARWCDVDEVRQALSGHREGPLIVPPGISISRLMLASWVRAVDAEELGGEMWEA